MEAGESLAKGSCRDGDLCGHLCVDQRTTAEDFAVEPAGFCPARSSVDDLDRSDDSRAGVSRGQLRYASSVARDDAYLGISLSGALFRMGGGPRSEVLTHATTIVAFFNAYVRIFIGPARQRYGVLDADAVGGCSHPSR